MRNETLIFLKPEIFVFSGKNFDSFLLFFLLKVFTRVFKSFRFDPRDLISSWNCRIKSASKIFILGDYNQWIKKIHEQNTQWFRMIRKHTKCSQISFTWTCWKNVKNHNKIQSNNLSETKKEALQIINNGQTNGHESNIEFRLASCGHNRNVNTFYALKSIKVTTFHRLVFFMWYSSIWLKWTYWSGDILLI